MVLRVVDGGVGGEAEARAGVCAHDDTTGTGSTICLQNYHYLQLYLLNEAGRDS